MKTTSREKLAELQNNPANIRNICILAHVDHGKTTLADTLVASNGIISQRMAGKLRYLDSREDEQIRGITMKSSAISLNYNIDDKAYLLNLIDSPGHVDFASEVSTAVRLCDGAVVLIDVVEGVCPQTHAVLRQAWLEDIRPVLVLNKLDRLIMEVKMTPLEAYIHLQQILEQVNAIMGELFTMDVLESSSKKPQSSTPAAPPDGGEQVYDWSSGLEDTDDSNLYFAPDHGNVVFASAIDGWGFGISHFANLYAAKLGVKAEVLKKTLWGDFYLEGKTKRIRKGAQAKGKKPLFVQFILENLWSVYQAVLFKRDKDMIEKIVKSMQLKILPRDTRHNDPRVHLQAICSQWLPLANAVLSMVVDKLPSPLQISPERVQKLLCPSSRRFDSLPTETQALKQAFLSCSPGDEAPVIVFVSKMFPVDQKSLPKNRQRPLSQEDIAKRRENARLMHQTKMASGPNSGENGPKETEKQEPTELASSSTEAPPSVENGPPCPADVIDEKEQVFVAFARVFSGTVRQGQPILVLGPKHDPARALQQTRAMIAPSASDCQSHVTPCHVAELYMFMGRELEDMGHVPAGNVLGIGGLEGLVLKSATLSSTVACPAFTEMYSESAPIVRVAVEPKVAGEMRQLREGLQLLNQADPCVQIRVQNTGEHVIIAAGEVHLQKCLDDLTQRFARIEVNVSPAIVPFRETIIPPPKVDMVNEAIQQKSRGPAKVKGDPEVLEPGLVELETADKLCQIRIRALPLPDAVTRLLDDHVELIRAVTQVTCTGPEGLAGPAGGSTSLSPDSIAALQEFKRKLEAAFAEAGSLWGGAVDQIWSFGPKRVGANILLNRVDGSQRLSFWSALQGADRIPQGRVRDFGNSIVSGFQMVTLSGPMAEEPMMGVCFSVEAWSMDPQLTARFRTLSEMSSNSLGDEDPQQTLVVENPDADVGDRRPVGIEEWLASVSDETADDVAGVPRECPEAAPDKEKVLVSRDGPDKRRREPASLGPFSGQLMSCVKEGCRKAFQSQPQRLMAAMYTCVIQATADVLGKLYAVLGKRNGRVLSEEMREGSSTFLITAVLPVIESFGFAEEFRKRTSGLASPQLRFSHWEVVDVDPYWEPTTEEEYMHFGEKADSVNVARAYMNSVRKRKGLKVDEKIVEFAEKQRTLSKNK